MLKVKWIYPPFDHSPRNYKPLSPIDERLIKAKAITGCLLAQDYDLHESNHAIFNGAVWVIETIIEEIEFLNDKLSKIRNHSK
jgi:hypothetical protein